MSVQPHERICIVSRAPRLCRMPRTLSSNASHEYTVAYPLYAKLSDWTFHTASTICSARLGGGSGVLAKADDDSVTDNDAAVMHTTRLRMVIDLVPGRLPTGPA